MNKAGTKISTSKTPPSSHPTIRQAVLAGPRRSRRGGLPDAHPIRPIDLGWTASTSPLRCGVWRSYASSRRQSPMVGEIAARDADFVACDVVGSSRRHDAATG